MTEANDDLMEIGDVVAEQTAQLCDQIVSFNRQIGFDDQEMGKLTDLPHAQWKAIRLGHYPEEFDFAEFTRISGLIETFQLALKHFQDGERVKTWFGCKNLAIYAGQSTPFDTIALHDDLEAVHDVLTIGDPNRILPEKKRGAA